MVIVRETYLSSIDATDTVARGIFHLVPNYIALPLIVRTGHTIISFEISIPLITPFHRLFGTLQYILKNFSSHFVFRRFP